ncbi:MAG: metallophosphoesterase [Actinobacteria bacterium]|nr:metallophosphoesterase [Actinomycetota bacterium]
MGPAAHRDGKLFAVSDLHVGHPDNRDLVARLRPESAADWLVIAGDVGETAAGIEWALSVLSERYRTVIWAPGNHELWTRRTDQVRLRGEERYRYLVDRCRELGVITPEDPFPVWQGEAGPTVIAPLFVLYDYSFLPEGTATRAEALARAYDTGIVCSDEALLHPDPYPSREAWCRARVAESERRLAALPPGVPAILVNHFPLVREPTRVLRYPVFAQWCGTELTAGWHRRFRALAVVYGHLHIPRTTWYDGVRFEEVSLGYPREWRRRAGPPEVPRQILPEVPRRPLAAAPRAATAPAGNGP